MLQHSRTPAAAILLATFLAGAAYIAGTRADGSSAQHRSLAELEQAIANPDASTDTWLVYAQRLQQEERYDHAVLAYQRVLETDP
jgi:Tfp pilus assembly protein PilF